MTTIIGQVEIPPLVDADKDSFSPGIPAGFSVAIDTPLSKE